MIAKAVIAAVDTPASLDKYKERWVLEARALSIEFCVYRSSLYDCMPSQRPVRASPIEHLNGRWE